MTPIIYIGAFLRLFSAGTYFEAYPEETSQSITFYGQHAVKFKEIGTAVKQKGAFVYAIVAPEISQYSNVLNFFEAQSLKVLYIQGGKAFGNFSIGPFQMKPSFVETLEAQIQKYPDLKKKYGHILIDKPDEREERKTRLMHLDELSWQFKYLKVFLALMLKKKYAFSNDYNKLKFYATSYNAGFLKPKKSIEAEYQKARFPSFSNPKFNYAAIAIAFYKRVK